MKMKASNWKKAEQVLLDIALEFPKVLWWDFALAGYQITIQKIIYLHSTWAKVYR